jgi:hypothetical protein
LWGSSRDQVLVVKQPAELESCGPIISTPKPSVEVGKVRTVAEYDTLSRNTEEEKKIA